MNFTRAINSTFKTQEEYDFTIIVCSTNQTSYNKLQQFFYNINFKNKILKAEPQSLKWMVAAYKPKFVVTDDNLWEYNDALDIIKDLRQANNTPLIIWSSSVSKKILNAVLRLGNIYHINDENNMINFWNTTSRISQQTA